MNRNAWSVFSVAAAVVCLTAISLPAVADSHEEAAPAYSMIHFDELIPANTPTYEKNAKDWVAAFKEAGAGAEWEWRTYSGPNFTYAFVTDVPNYAYLDGDDERWAAMSEKIGAEKIAKLSAESGAEAHRHELVKEMPELSHMPTGGPGEVGFVRLARHTVKPGMGDRFKELAGKVMEAHKKAGSSMTILASEVHFGEGSYQFVTLAKDAASYYAATTTKSMGAILTEAYGAEQAQAMFKEWRDCITDYETSDWEFRPDLSYMPGMYEEAEMKKEMGGSAE